LTTETADVPAQHKEHSGMPNATFLGAACSQT